MTQKPPPLPGKKPKSAPPLPEQRRRVEYSRQAEKKAATSTPRPLKRTRSETRGSRPPLPAAGEYQNSPIRPASNKKKKLWLLSLSAVIFLCFAGWILVTNLDSKPQMGEKLSEKDHQNSEVAVLAQDTKPVAHARPDEEKAELTAGRSGHKLGLEDSKPKPGNDASFEAAEPGAGLAWAKPITSPPVTRRETVVLPPPKREESTLAPKIEEKPMPAEAQVDSERKQSPAKAAAIPETKQPPSEATEITQAMLEVGTETLASKQAKEKAAPDINQTLLAKRVGRLHIIYEGRRDIGWARRHFSIDGQAYRLDGRVRQKVDLGVYPLKEGEHQFQILHNKLNFSPISIRIPADEETYLRVRFFGLRKYRVEIKVNGQTAKEYAFKRSLFN